MWRSGTSPTRRWQLSPSSWTDCSRARESAARSPAESGSNRRLGARSCTIPTSEPTTLIPHLRWARVRPGVACGIGLVLFVAALTEALPAAGYEPPGLRPGDFWTYRTNTSLASGFFLEGTATLRVLARATQTGEGVSVDAYLGVVDPDGRGADRISRVEDRVERARPGDERHVAHGTRFARLPAERPEHDDRPFRRRHVALPVPGRGFRSRGRAAELLRGLPPFLWIAHDAIPLGRPRLAERHVCRGSRGVCRGARGLVRHRPDSTDIRGRNLRAVVSRSGGGERREIGNAQRIGGPRLRGADRLSIPSPRTIQVPRPDRRRLDDRRGRSSGRGRVGRVLVGSEAEATPERAASLATSGLPSPSGDHPRP